MKASDPQHAAEKRQELQERNASLGRKVLHSLGHPDDLRRVQVCPLWQGHYRVNVFVGPDIASARVAHSYFLVADGEGNIVSSIPGITRQYDLTNAPGRVGGGAVPVATSPG
jgi:hypothetical protein